MNEAARRGIVPTSFSFDPVIGDGRAVITGAPFDGSDKDSAILADFRGKVDKLKADDATKKRLLDEGTAALKGPFQTGVNEMITAIESLRAKSPGPHGVWKLPDGDAYYKTADQVLDDGTRSHGGTDPPDRPRRSRAHQGRDAGDHEAGRLPGRPAGVLQAPAHGPEELLPEHARGQAGLPRPVEGLHRLDLLGRQAVLQRAAEGAARSAARSRSGAKRRRRSRSTTSRRPTAAGRASTT